jgi:hypothetical protein
VEHRSQSHGEPTVGRCDLCGREVRAGSAFTDRVLDSAYLDDKDARQDGTRPLFACSLDHLKVLRRQYLQRRFQVEELWARKVTRAIQNHPEGVTAEQLTQETGLTLPQIDRAVQWRRNTRLRMTEQSDTPRSEAERHSGGSPQDDAD